MNNSGTSRHPVPVPAISYTKTIRCAGPCHRTRSHNQFAQGSALCLMCARRSA